MSPFIWYEISTHDVEATAKFYSAVIGWVPKPMDAPGFPYTVLAVGEAGVSGILKVKEEWGPDYKPGWMGYIVVPDADEYASKIVAAGGTQYVEPTDIPGIGRFAVLADPQGAVFTIMKPSIEDRPVPMPPKGTQGTAGWHELHTTNYVEAFDFYSKIFGWTLLRDMDLGGGYIYRIFSMEPGQESGGIINKWDDAPSHWNFYFSVDNATEAAGRIESAGGTVHKGPMEVPGGTFIVIASDSQGTPFYLVSATK